jgi:hypothetical protein
MRVFLYTERTVNRRGRGGVRQRWIAETEYERQHLRHATRVSRQIGTGRTRRAAIKDLAEDPLLAIRDIPKRFDNVTVR